MKTKLLGIAVAVLVASAAFGLEAQAGVVLGNATYYGGSGNDYAFGAVAANGGLYIAGAAEVSGYHQGLGLFYSPASATSPIWELTRPDTTTSGRRGDYFYGVSATDAGVYFAGAGSSLATDGSGGFESKSLLASFPLTGATGPVDGANWYRSPNVFTYRGGEAFAVVLADKSQNAVFAVGGGETYGWGQSAAYAFRYDSEGKEIWQTEGNR